MSRAFTKERDDAPEPEVAPRRAPGSRAITPAGFESLQARLTAATDPVERGRLERTLAAVRVVEPPTDRSAAAIGATVTLDDGKRSKKRFAIVGEDEVDVAAGRIGIDSPLAQALLGTHVGDSVVWPRPAGDLTVTVRAIDY